jgi:hypothetical protein
MRTPSIKSQENFKAKAVKIIKSFGGILIHTAGIDKVFTYDERWMFQSNEDTYLVRTVAGVYGITIRPEHYSIFGKFADEKRAYREGFTSTPHCPKLNSVGSTQKDVLAWLNNVLVSAVNGATSLLDQEVLKVNKHEPHLDLIVSEMTNEICRKINFNANMIDANTPYKAQMILETLIKELETRV